MPIPVTKATAPECVLTATRGPDTGEVKRKCYGASVIRYWILDWRFGIVIHLPFVVVAQPTRDHYSLHIVEAARALDLPCLNLDPETLPIPPNPWWEQESWHRWVSGWCRVFGATKQPDGGY